MFKKIIILISCTLLITTIFTGCSSKNEENTPISLTEENIYLAGKYTRQWDATEKYARAYYKLDESKEFVKPSFPFIIEVNLEINKDGTYKIYTEENLIRFSFDTFLNDNIIYELELYNLFDGDNKKWTDYRNENCRSSNAIITEMVRDLPINALEISENDNFYIKDNVIILKNGSASIEHINNVVRLKFSNDNNYTNNEISFIKK